VPVPVFCCFCILEKLYRKYSQNWMKQKPKFLFIWHEDGVQRRDGAEPGGGHTMGWRGLPLAALGPGMAPPGALWHCPSTCKFTSLGKTLRARTSIHEKYYKPPLSSTLVREGLEALPGTLPERGIIAGGLLHLHAWVVHLGLWVHSSS
jgi:hypothetical protein